MKTESHKTLSTLLLIIFGAIIVNTTWLRAETIVPGGLISGTWTLDGSPYIVQGSIVVTQATTLTIQPGVTVKFHPTTSLTVNGVLAAIGTADQKIVFTAISNAPSPNRWIGISIQSGDSPQTVLHHVDINSAQTGLVIKTSSFGSPNVNVSDADIHHNGIGVSASSTPGQNLTNVTLFASRIYSNQQLGLYFTSSSDNQASSGNYARLEGSEVYANSGYGIKMRAGFAGTFSGGEASAIRCWLVGNAIRNNSSGIATETANPIDLMSIEPVIENNLIVSNSYAGMLLTAAAGEQLAPRVVNNTVLKNTTFGIAHSVNSPSGLVIRNNTIVLNGRGITADTAYLPAAGLIAFNNIHSNTLHNWGNYPSSFGDLTATNANCTPADSEMNISADPLFAADSFHLSAGSPCVNAGTSSNAPATDYDGQRRGSLPDIGCDELFVPPQFVFPAKGPDSTFSASILGEPGLALAVEASVNLTNWSQILILTNVTGTVLFTDTNQPAPDMRLYRVREMP